MNAMRYTLSMVLTQNYPSPRPSPTRGEGTFPLLMGGINGGWYIFMMANELCCQNNIFKRILKHNPQFSLISLCSLHPLWLNNYNNHKRFWKFHMIKGVNLFSGIGRKLLCWFLTLSILPIMVVAILTYQYARETIKNELLNEESFLAEGIY